MIKDGEVVCRNTVALVTSLVIALTSSNREETQVPYSHHNHRIGRRVRIQIFVNLSPSKVSILFKIYFEK